MTKWVYSTNSPQT